MACLDTNILLAFLKNEKNVADKVAVQAPNLSITPINAAELFKGVYKRGEPLYAQKVRGLLNSLVMLEFNLNSAEIAGQIYSTLSKRGLLISDMDIIIAAICIAHDETLITRDKDFQNIEGLKTELW